jgi:hypothetical protein
MSWLAVIVMCLSQRGAALFHAVPRFLGNKTVSGTKGGEHPQPRRSLSLTRATSHRSEVRDYRWSQMLPRRTDAQVRRD